MKHLLILLALFLAACEGDGSEIGPVAPAIPKQFFSGQVLAANGSPIVGAAVSIEGEGSSAATDCWGRFRIANVSNGAHTLSVDGRTGASRGVGESFPKLRVPVTVSGSTPLSFPIVLPNLADAAGQAEQKTVAVGSTLGAGDDISISGAGLTLTLNGALLAWTTPSDHAGETQVAVSAAILPSHQSPFYLESSGGVALHTALVLWIDPADVTFTTPASLSYSSSFFFDGSTEVFLFRHDPDSQTWTATGAASVAGGVITATGAVTSGGLYAIAKIGYASPTAITGRVLDGDGTALAGALVAASGGRSAVTGADGTFSFSGVAALDGAGAILSGTVAVAGSSVQLPMFLSQSLALVPSGTTSFGDLTLRTQKAGEIHFLLVRKGVALPYREVSVGAHSLGFGTRKKTDAEGIVDFFGVPFDAGETFQAITAEADTTKSPIAVDSGGFFFSPSQLYSANLYTGPTGTFSSNGLGGSIQVTVLREDSDAPIENALVMVGTDPSTSQKGWTNASGQIQLSASGAPSITVGVQTTAPAGWGTSYALVRKTVYRTVEGVSASSLVIRLPVAQRLDAVTAPWDPFGRVSGDVSEATNPTVTVPANISGIYPLDLHGSPAGDPKQLFTALDERSDYDALTPSGTDASAGYSAGGVLDAAFTIDAPAPRAFLVGVERDATSATSGSITRFGLAGPLVATPGGMVSNDLALDHAIASGSVPISVTGLESALAPPQASLGIETGEGLAALLGDADAQVSGFSASTGAGALLLPSLSGALAGGAYRVRLFGELSSGGILRRQDAFLRIPGSSASGQFLAVPEFSTPSPGGSDFDPTGAGVVWTSSSEAQLHRVRVTRSQDTTESGLLIRDDFDWQLFTPAGDSAAVFPTLPTTVSGSSVPAFFGSAQAFTVEIRAVRASSFHYGSFFANTARVRLSELDPTAESRYSAAATTP